MSDKINYKAKIEKLEGSRVRVTVSVDTKEFEKMFEPAKAKVLSEAKLNGFRDGKVPYEAFIKAYGEFPIRQEMGYMTVDKTYINVILGEKIEPIGQPSIAITSVKKDGDFEYQIETDVLPKVEVGDYKKYHSDIKVDDIQKATVDEVNDAVEELRRMRTKKGEDGSEIIPEIDEEFLKTVGDFKTIEDLKKRIEENINNEKTWNAQEKRKAAIFEKLVADTKTDTPKSLIENELTKIEERIKADLAQMGVSFEDYLRHMKKTYEEWKDSESETARKQVILQLALHAISKKENIVASDMAVKHEVAHLVEHYPTIDPERARAYTEEKMNNTLVLEYLLTGKVPDEKEIFGSHEGHNH